MAFVFQNRTSRNPMEEIRREIEILRRLAGHPNIIKLIDVVEEEEDDNLYLVFEKLDRELMTIPTGEFLKIEPAIKFKFQTQPAA